ncbi:MAG TPA: hypothetical protein VJ891_09405 [Casimicrobiaceae bacterium]|nr:hypothetical protein [Casimicrobiaceae bacterium]
MSEDETERALVDERIAVDLLTAATQSCALAELVAGGIAHLGGSAPSKLAFLDRVQFAVEGIARLLDTAISRTCAALDEEHRQCDGAASPFVVVRGDFGGEPGEGGGARS